MGKIHLAALIWALHLPASGASAAAIVNGGFETGDLTGWMVSGNTEFIGPGSFFPHSGTYALEAGPVGSLGFVTQTLSTVPGAGYEINFWLANDCGSSLTCSQPNAFRVSWGDQIVYSATDLPTMDYTHLEFPVAAANTNTDLTFGFQQDQFSFYLDDVAVAAVPEPRSVLLVLTGGMLLAVWVGKSSNPRA